MLGFKLEAQLMFKTRLKRSYISVIRPRSLILDPLLLCAGEQRELQRREEAAVEAEDFETAASLSARLDQLSGRVLLLTADVRSAEADCEATSACPTPDACALVFLPCRCVKAAASLLRSKLLLSKSRDCRLWLVPWAFEKTSNNNCGCMKVQNP